MPLAELAPRPRHSADMARVDCLLARLQASHAGAAQRCERWLPAIAASASLILPVDESRPTSPADAESLRPLPAHRRRRPDRRRQDDAVPTPRRPLQARRRYSRSRRAIRSSSGSTGQRALRAADAAVLPLPARQPVARPRPAGPVHPRGDRRLPDREGSAVRTSDPVGRRTRALPADLRQPAAAGTDAGPGRSTCRPSPTRWSSGCRRAV